MKVYNMKSAKGNTIANQFIIEDTDKKIFQSYDSTIAEIDYKNMEIIIYPDYNYSRTTGKYRNIFFEDYCCMHEIATLCGLEKAIKDGFYQGFFKFKVRMANVI